MRLSYKRYVEKGAMLMLSAALTMPLLACYPKDIHAFPQIPRIIETGKGPVKAEDADRRYVSGKVECATNGLSFEYRFSDGTKKIIDRMLEPKESVIGLVCSDAYAFVLTDTSLISVPGNAVSRHSSGMSLNLSFVRTDMRKMYKRGLLAWAASEDKCFFLTKDSEIREMPAEGDSLIHSIPYDLSNAAMVFHSGFLFIAPAQAGGKRYLVAMRFADKARFRGIELPPGGGDIALLVREGKLWLGQDEIIISGPTLADVRLERKE